MEGIHACLAWQDRAGARGGDGHADEMAEIGSVLAERCWRKEVGGRGLHVQVGVISPIVRYALAGGRGDGMALWNTRVPGCMCGHSFGVVWQTKHGSCYRICNGLLQSLTVKSSTRVPGCLAAAG